jgi:hypothetical protein
MSAVSSHAGKQHGFLDIKRPDFRFDPFEQPAVSIGRNAFMRCFTHVHSLRHDALHTQIYGFSYSEKWAPTQVRFMSMRSMLGGSATTIELLF